MDKNFNLENAKNIIAEVSGVPVNTTFGSITKPIDLLLEVIDMSADLIALIREETELKKHHRAYLHVHEELEDCADEMAARMQEIFDETTDCVIGLMKDVHETFRVRKQEAAEDDADNVTIAKEDYEDDRRSAHDVRNHPVRRRYAHAGYEGNPRVRQVRPRLRCL